MERTTPLDPREIRLVVEILSRSNPDNDYLKKTADYRAMGIPNYLIIDPRQGTCLHLFQIGIVQGKPAYEGDCHISMVRRSGLATWSSIPPVCRSTTTATEHLLDIFLLVNDSGGRPAKRPLARGGG